MLVDLVLVLKEVSFISIVTSDYNGQFAEGSAEVAALRRSMAWKAGAAAVDLEEIRR